MIPGYSLASSFRGNILSMLWIVLFLLLNRVQQIYSDITITSGSCGEVYDADYYKSVSVEYYGSDLLYANPCSIEFTKYSTDQYLCVSGQEIQLDCDTMLEYHEGFVKNYISPEKKISCTDMSSLEEWCPSQYQDNIFIVIRKSAVITTDVIRLRVYLKDVPKDDGVSAAALYTAFPIVVVVIVICAVIGACLKTSKLSGGPQAANQTVSGTTNMQAGNRSPYQTTAGYQPSPRASHPAQQGNQHWTGPEGSYNIHSMQTAYAAHQDSAPAYQSLLPQESTAESSASGQQYPDAQPLNADEAPPPSYESVMGIKQ
ncbi:uncharacterized protein LOC128547876 [Mercenaria mercenaria]|uniref:uncharacterized protein LOC128547876 n=1 Tax=Mercenaria mercenaria TaxID=6596 RepID=UPI00234F01B5|nr:uncharacterized protein LOC128547876 [Mercenaria mercenaria]XP_053377422.1 uncharacterized protein LOC128547876 [Mercenaria mercenaria]XP_053377423.1 uncharacterized protein LOC128547876 [Mercenaria mercenaria]